MKKIIVLVFLSMLFVACQSEQYGSGQEKTSHIEVTDIEGRVIRFEKPVERIVDCTGLGGTRLLIQLESEDKVVGITDHAKNAITGIGESGIVFHPTRCAAKEMVIADIPSIGSYNEPSVQVIIALEPDVILVGWGGKELADTLQKQTGIKTVCIGRMDGRFDYDLLEIVGKLIGKEERTTELIEFTKEKLEIVSNVTDKIAKEDKKTLYFWIHPVLGNPPRSNGIYDAFEYAGGINVASTDDNQTLYETSKEQIVAWDPDFVFLQSFNKGKTEGYYTAEQLKEDAVLQHISAVRMNNIYKLKGPNADWDIAVELAEVFYVAKILYPELFDDLDVETHCNEIFEKFYGVENLYSEMRIYLDLTFFE